MRMFIAQNKSGKIPPFANTYIEEYGGLYNWWAMDGLASDGWRVPSDAELTTLTNYINTNYNQDPDDFGVGCHLKSERTAVGDPERGISTNVHPRWDYHADNYGRDTVKFAALPGGRRWEYGYFATIGSNGHWWSSTEFDDTRAWYRGMYYDQGNVIRHYYFDKFYGFSARCLRDATTNEQDSEHEDFIAEETIIPNEYTGHDEKTYDAVRIGDQVWITENLKETKRMVGEDIVDIAIVTDDTTWSELETAAMCAYPK